ncbi:MAG: proton-conducting transporter membrane subunit [Myxococcota bacterium]
MTTGFALAAIACLAGSGFAAACARRPVVADRIGAALVAAGAVLGVLAAGLALAGHGDELVFPSALPGGAWVVGVDALSALFLLPVFAVTLACSVYSLEYFGAAEHPRAAGRLRIAFGLTSAGFALVLVARHALVLLAGWEVMAIAAFFAVTADDREREVRDAGFLYLVCTRASTLCLLALFALFWTATGSLELVAAPPGRIPLAQQSAIFALALAGFGLKAGLVPLHIWLAPAHAAAPTHVSALLSGVLIKAGIYGLVRVVALLPDTPLWWGQALLGLGVVSAVLGVAFALAQHDVKRLLAYHSVENIGIIAIGLGLALLARALARPEIALLALAGALLHVVNHALFKSLLFLAAGAVIRTTGTRSVDALGGVAKAMPVTAFCFLAGAVAIVGLPPLNGFISEFLIYTGLLRVVALETGRAWLLAVLAVPALALTGGLALACFAKVFGAVFLGLPRSDASRAAREAPAAMLGAMGGLVVLCAAIGLAPFLIAPALEAASGAVLPVSAEMLRAPVASLSLLNLGVLAVCALVGVALGVRLMRGPRAASGTWDCGYAAPTASMQYSASSFAELLVGAFEFALRPRVHAPRLAAILPGAASFHSDVPDLVLDRVVSPAGRALARGFGRVRALQQGSVHAYLLYVWLTLVALLIVTGVSG